MDRISEMLFKSLAGSLPEEEQAELKRWEAEEPSAGEILRSLSDPVRLQEEYARWRSVPKDQPRESMRARIRAQGRGRRRLLLIAGAFAAVVLIVASLVALNRSERRYEDLYASFQAQRYMHSIRPGQTKARLTTEDGKVVVLGSDAANNDKALRAAAEVDKVRKRKEREARLALNRLEIPRGGEFHITLEDGTEVWLNAESALRYPDCFGGQEREVELSGEAYFKVARENSRPFRVRIAGQVIEVHGTEFNVMSYDEDQYVYTTLVEGSISLHPDNDNPSELILTPGHQAVFGKADCSTSVRRVKTEVVTSWRSGMFVFEDQTLDQIMRQLSRWYDFTYEFSGVDVASTVFMGRMPRYGTFGEVLDILERSGNLAFRVSGNQILISGK